MPDLSGAVPILGRTHHIDGGQEHAVEMTTTDGNDHVVTFMFQAPKGPGGTVDLGAVKDVDWERQALNAVGQQVSMCHLMEIPEGSPPGTKPPVMIPAQGKRMVVLAHVTAFRYLGRVTAKTGQNVVVQAPDGTVSLHWFSVEAEMAHQLGPAVD